MTVMAASDPRHASAKPAENPPPLAGARVLEFAQIISGPYCALMLANLGAEVVKVEMPGRGDDLRTVGRYEGREAHQDYFDANNYSKKSIALDLKSPGGRAAVRDLARLADVVIENFSPGTARRLGVGWEDLEPLNPRLVYCSISGFGQSGPYRDRMAMDPIIQAISGVMSVTGEGGGRPMQIGAPLADVIAGMCAATAIVGALYAVRGDGRGRHIDMSMQAAMVAALGPRMGGALQAGIAPERIGNENPMRVPSDVYVTRDGVNLFIMVQNDRIWEPFCRALGCPEWIADPRFADNRLRTRSREAINRLVCARLAEWTAAEIIPRFEAERVPFARVNDYVEALADPQLVHRGQVRTVVHPTSGPIRVVGPPWIISGTDIAVAPPPLLGQHTAEVLAGWLGWGQAEIATRIGEGGDDARTLREPHHARLGGGRARGKKKPCVR